MATLTWDQVKTHNTDVDCWVVVHGNGGKDIILDQAGKDVTDVFEEAAHSSEARHILPSLFVGRLQGYHDNVQTFDTIVGREKATAKAEPPWNGSLLGPVAISFVALTTWGYGRNIPSMIDPVWIGIAVFLLTALGAFSTFVSYIIYVDFGRLEKFPSRMEI